MTTAEAIDLNRDVLARLVLRTIVEVPGSTARSVMGEISPLAAGRKLDALRSAGLIACRHYECGLLRYYPTAEGVDAMNCYDTVTAVLASSVAESRGGMRMVGWSAIALAAVLCVVAFVLSVSHC